MENKPKKQIAIGSETDEILFSKNQFNIKDVGLAIDHKEKTMALFSAQAVSVAKHDDNTRHASKKEIKERVVALHRSGYEEADHPQRIAMKAWLPKNAQFMKAGDMKKSPDQSSLDWMLKKFSAAGIEVVTDKAEFADKLGKVQKLQKMIEDYQTLEKMQKKLETLEKEAAKAKKEYEKTTTATEEELEKQWKEFAKDIMSAAKFIPDLPEKAAGIKGVRNDDTITLAFRQDTTSEKNVSKSMLDLEPLRHGDHHYLLKSNGELYLTLRKDTGWYETVYDFGKGRFADGIMTGDKDIDIGTYMRLREMKGRFSTNLKAMLNQRITEQKEAIESYATANEELKSELGKYAEKPAEFLKKAPEKGAMQEIYEALNKRGLYTRTGSTEKLQKILYMDENEQYHQVETLSTAGTRKEYLDGLIDLCRNFDSEEFHQNELNRLLNQNPAGSYEEQQKADTQTSLLASEVSHRLKECVPDLERIRNALTRRETSVDLYKDLRTVVAAFGNDDEKAFKSCHSFDIHQGEPLCAECGDWKIAKGGYDKLWELSIKKKTGGHVPFAEAVNGEGYDTVLLTNRQAVRDAGLNPYKALSVVKETWENPRAVYNEIEPPTEREFVKHVDAQMFGFVGFTGDVNEEGARIYSREDVRDENGRETGLKARLQNIIASSSLAAMNTQAEDIAYRICDYMQPGARAWTSDKDSLDYQAAEAWVKDALSDHNVIGDDYDNTGDYEETFEALTDEVVDFMAENTYAKFVHDNMPEIDFEVAPHHGGTIIKETETGRDILLQPGDESNGFSERYEKGLVGEDEMRSFFPDNVPQFMKPLSKRPSKREYENHLNEEFSDLYRIEHLLEKYAYLANENSLVKAYDENRFGSLLRRNDPVLFEVGYDEYCAETELEQENRRAERGEPSAADIEEMARIFFESNGFEAEILGGQAVISVLTPEGDPLEATRFGYGSAAELVRKLKDMTYFNKTEFVGNSVSAYLEMNEDSFRSDSEMEAFVEEKKKNIKPLAEKAAKIFEEFSERLLALVPAPAQFMMKAPDLSEESVVKSLELHGLTASADGKTLSIRKIHDGDEIFVKDIEYTDAADLAEKVRAMEKQSLATDFSRIPQNARDGETATEREQRLLPAAKEIREAFAKAAPEMSRMLAPETGVATGDVIDRIEEAGFDVNLDADQKGSVEITIRDSESGEYRSVATLFPTSAENLANEIFELSNNFSEDEFAKSLLDEEDSYEGHVVHADCIKNQSDFFDVAEEYGFSGEDVIRHITNWNGMQIVTREFLENLCSDYELDPTQFDISDDITKNINPLWEIMVDTINADAEQATRIFSNWNGAQIFSADFMDNLYRVELELDNDSDKHAELASEVQEALEAACDSIHEMYQERKGAEPAQFLKTSKARISLGEANSIEEEEGRKAGTPVAGYEKTITETFTGNTIQNHTSEVIEAAKGNIPVTEADMKLADQIMKNPDFVVFEKESGRKPGDLPAVIYGKSTPDGKSLYVGCVAMPKAKEIRAVSMIKKAAPASASMFSGLVNRDMNVRKIDDAIALERPTKRMSDMVDGAVREIARAKSERLVKDSTVYGFAYDGKIYLNPDIMTSEAAAHEYTHLWDSYIQKANPALWKQGKEFLKKTRAWKDIESDPGYADIAKNEDLLASEVHARLTGRFASEMLERSARIDGEILEKRVQGWAEDAWFYIESEMEFGSEDFRREYAFRNPTIEIAGHKAGTPESGIDFKKINRFWIDSAFEKAEGLDPKKDIENAIAWVDKALAEEESGWAAGGGASELKALKEILEKADPAQWKIKPGTKAALANLLAMPMKDLTDEKPITKDFGEPKKRYYAVQMDPASAEDATLKDSLESDGITVLAYGDGSNYASIYNGPFDFTTSQSEVADNFDSLVKMLNEGKNEDFMIEVNDLYPKKNGEAYTLEEVEKWKSLVKSYDMTDYLNDAVHEAMRGIAEMTSGRKHDLETIRGSSQGQIVDILIPHEYNNKEYVEYLEASYWNEGEEWLVTESPSAKPLDPDGIIEGQNVAYYVPSYNSSVRLAAQIGCRPDELVMFPHMNTYEYIHHDARQEADGEVLYNIEQADEYKKAKAEWKEQKPVSEKVLDELSRSYDRIHAEIAGIVARKILADKSEADRFRSRLGDTDFEKKLFEEVSYMNSGRIRAYLEKYTDLPRLNTQSGVEDELIALMPSLESSKEFIQRLSDKGVFEKGPVQRMQERAFSDERRFCDAFIDDGATRSIAPYMKACQNSGDYDRAGDFEWNDTNGEREAIPCEHMEVVLIPDPGSPHRNTLEPDEAMLARIWFDPDSGKPDVGEIWVTSPGNPMKRELLKDKNKRGHFSTSNGGIEVWLTEDEMSGLERYAARQLATHKALGIKRYTFEGEVDEIIQESILDPNIEEDVELFVERTNAALGSQKITSEEATALLGFYEEYNRAVVAAPGGNKLLELDLDDIDEGCRALEDCDIARMAENIDLFTRGESLDEEEDRERIEDLALVDSAFEKWTLSKDEIKHGIEDSGRKLREFLNLHRKDGTREITPEAADALLAIATDNGAEDRFSYSLDKEGGKIVETRRGDDGKIEAFDMSDPDRFVFDQIEKARDKEADLRERIELGIGARNVEEARLSNLRGQIAEMDAALMSLTDNENMLKTMREADDESKIWSDTNDLGCALQAFRKGFDENLFLADYEDGLRTTKGEWTVYQMKADAYGNTTKIGIKRRDVLVAEYSPAEYSLKETEYFKEFADMPSADFATCVAKTYDELVADMKRTVERADPRVKAFVESLEEPKPNTLELPSESREQKIFKRFVEQTQKNFEKSHQHVNVKEVFRAAGNAMKHFNEEEKKIIADEIQKLGGTGKDAMQKVMPRLIGVEIEKKRQPVRGITVEWS